MKQKRKLTDRNFKTDLSWMPIRLGLYGEKKDIFSIIWGFSQDGTSVCDCSIAYFKEWTGVTENTIRKYIKELSDANLIKEVPSLAGFENRFIANVDYVNKVLEGEVELTPAKIEGVPKTTPSKTEGVPPQKMRGLIINNIISNKEREDAHTYIREEEVKKSPRDIAYGWLTENDQTLERLLINNQMITEPRTHEEMISLLDRYINRYLDNLEDDGVDIIAKGRVATKSYFRIIFPKIKEVVDNDARQTATNQVEQNNPGCSVQESGCISLYD